MHENKQSENVDFVSDAVSRVESRRLGLVAALCSVTLHTHFPQADRRLLRGFVVIRALGALARLVRPPEERLRAVQVALGLKAACQKIVPGRPPGPVCAPAPPSARRASPSAAGR